MQKMIRNLKIVKSVKSIVLLEDGIYIFDAIEHEGLFWIVPEWIDIQRPGWSRPERIVRPTTQAFRQTPGSTQMSLPNPVSKAVLFGPIPKESIDGYVVIGDPDLCTETHAIGPVS